jgi:hypothetical protein
MMQFLAALLPGSQVGSGSCLRIAAQVLGALPSTTFAVK